MEAVTRNRLLQAVPYIVIAALAAVVAYMRVFSSFEFFDDEGYFLQSISEFLHGGKLYDEVYTQYGPVYYELFGGFFKLTGIELTMDNTRLLVIGLWLATATGAGVIAQVVTGRLWLGLTVQITAFGVLHFAAREPMHPTGLIAFFVLLLVAVMLLAGKLGPRRSAIAAGVALALIALTKINVGALVCVAVLAAALMTLATPAFRVRAFVAGAALAALAPVILVSSALDVTWVIKLLGLYLAGLAAVLVRLWTSGATSPEPVLRRWLTTTTIAGAGTAAVVLLVIFATGAAPGAVFDGVVVAPLHHPSVILGLLITPSTAINVILVSLALVLVSTQITARQRERWQLPRGGARLAVAIMTWVAALGVEWTQPPGLRVALVIAGVWLVVREPDEFESSQWTRFARASAAMIALLNVLQAYPSPGGQLMAGLLPFVLLGAVTANDGLRLIALWVQRNEDWRAASRWAIAIGATTVIAVTGYPAIVDAGRAARYQYRTGVQPQLRGAQRLRLPAQQARDFGTLVAATKGCDPLVTLPGLDSFYGWSGLRPPNGQNTGDWVELLDDKRQQEVVDAIKDKPRLCVLRNTGIATGWWGHLSRDGVVPDRPLWRYLNSLPVTDKVVLKAGITADYQLQVRK